MVQCSLSLLVTFLQEDSRAKIASVLQELCGEDCKLDIYQKDNSDEIIVSGQYVQGQQHPYDHF